MARNGMVSECCGLSHFLDFIRSSHVSVVPFAGQLDTGY